MQAELQAELLPCNHHLPEDHQSRRKKVRTLPKKVCNFTLDDIGQYAGSDDKNESVKEKRDELLDGIIEIDRTFLRWRPVSVTDSNPQPLTI
jgi:hypothetical protein